MKKSILLVLLTTLFILPLKLAGADVHVTHDYKKGEPSLVHAVGTIVGNSDDVWENMIRFNDYASFMPRVIDSFFISQEGIQAIQAAGTRNASRLRSVAQRYKVEGDRKKNGVWSGFVFMVINTPFPVENRWYILNVTQDETQAAVHTYKRCWNLVEGNIEAAEGCWQVQPDAIKGKSLLTYQDHVNPGGKVPEWIARMGATKTVPEMFESLEKVAKK